MILLIYNEKICKEILLPNIYDEDMTIELSRDFYDLPSDIYLTLENRDGSWRLRDSAEFEVRRRDGNSECFTDGSVTEIRTRSGETVYLVASDTDVAFNVMKKYDITGLNKIRIGKDEANTICYKFQNLISSAHMKMERHGSEWYIYDSSRNGVFCENRRVSGTFRPEFGECINIFGLHIVYLGNYLLVGANCGDLKVNEDILTPAVLNTGEDKLTPAKREHQTYYFNRSPRSQTILYRDKVEIEAPPQLNRSKPKPTYLVIGPAFSMAIPMVIGCLMMIFASSISRRSGGGMGTSPFIFMGLTIAVGAAIVGAVWAILNLRYDKQQRAAEEEQRYNAYSSYLVEIAGRLREYYIYNTEALHTRYPSAAECLGYTRNSPQLWNRNTSHDDYLFQRIGLGEQDFQVQIDIPKEKFTLVRDSLQDRPAQIKEEFSRLVNVPVGIDLLSHSLIGIAGGRGGAGSCAVMQTLVSNIAASHSYTDVKLVFIYDENDRNRLQDWECMKWLPHVWSEDRKIRFMAGTRLEQSEVMFHIANVIRTRAENAPSVSRRAEIPRPYYIIFVSNPALLEGEILTKYIYDKNSSYGITTVLMAENQHQLPNACDIVIENDKYFKGIIDLASEDRGKKQDVLFDTVDRRALESFGKRLANISVKELELNTEIPDSLGFLEMYGVHSPDELGIGERWRKNRTYNSMKALIGRKAGGQDCYLDIHEKFHGPHGLVAGTTGSGKSETLQTYILSLAVNYSPADVSFFVIDYKGGGMANLFEGLPHLAGTISNLSGNQVHRAMISIKSENLRRQRLFAQNGVNHINAYTRLYKEHRVSAPIPHLFIVIDEFAELKREEPDFMRELISVAQVGRSLGVHLILATQKPSGTVDDNIQANSKFRLCLRVQDRQDSMDMLHRPDAAYLTQAGRCYMQVGNDEIFELFQSGYSGAIYTGEGQTISAAELIGRTGRTELIGRPSTDQSVLGGKTEMDAVIEHLREIADREGYENSAQLWMPVLSEHIVLETQEEALWKGSRTGRKWNLRSVVGLYDDPANQLQDDLVIDFAETGHVAVCGGIVSGKSTFLQTMVYSLITTYAPDEVQLYLLDYSGQMLIPFAGAPHVGGTVSDSQDEKLSKFFVMLDGLMEERKAKLKGGNFVQYKQVYEDAFPAILVVIDNYASFREKTGDRYDAMITRLVREGVSYGIFLVLSAAGFGMSDIPTRTGDSISTVISLEQQDKFKYMEVLRQTRLPIIPDSGIKGRGLAAVGDRVLEFQTYLCLEAEDDFSRGQELEKKCAEMSAVWEGSLPKPIPEIPDDPTMEILSQNPDYIEALSRSELLPVGYDAEDASVYSLDLSHHYCIAVSGRARTGKTTILRSIMSSCGRKEGAQIAVLEKKKEYSRLEQDAAAGDYRYAGSNAEVFAYFSELIPEFSRRNRRKQELIKAGLSEEEITAEMLKEPPVFIFIDDMSDFIQMAYKPEEGIGSMSGFLENILEKGKMHSIYFIAGIKAEDEPGLTVYKAYNLFASYKRGMHAGGNLTAQKIFQFTNVPFAEQSKVQKKGYVYIADDEEEGVGHKVVIPVP